MNVYRVYRARRDAMLPSGLENLSEIKVDKYRMTLVDRIMLFGKKIEGAKKLNDHITIFAVSRPTRALYYKFRYAGNTQYHRVEYDDLDEFWAQSAALKELISGEMGNGR